MKSTTPTFLIGFWLIALSTPTILLQASDNAPWPPISPEELAMKGDPANPGSSAMILEREIYTDDEKRLGTVWVRIKIFTEEGRKYADVEIPYFAKSTTIEGIRGRAVRQDGTAIEFHGTIFDKVVAKYKKLRYEAKAFTLAGVEVGSVIDYAYTVRWQEGLPNYVRSPGDYVFKAGWTIPTTTWTIQQELFTRHARFTLRPVKAGRLEWTKVRLPDTGPSGQPDGTVRMDVTNVAAIQEEEYMPPDSMLNSRVHFYYTVGLFGDFWLEYGRRSAQNAEKFIEKTKSLERAAKGIAPSSEPPETRLRKLYARVQQIRYVSYEPSKTEKEVKREHLAENKSAEDVLRHGYGYGNEINFLFTALARAAGFDASIVEVVNRGAAVFEPTVLDASQLNAIVVRVRLNGKNLYFDPASRFCPYGLVPWYETNTGGVRWDKFGGEGVNLPAQSSETAVIERTAELKLQPDGGLEGRLEIAFAGQEALDRRLQALDTDEAGRRKLVEDEIKDWLPSGATVDLDSVSGWESSEEPLRVKCRLHALRFAALTRQRMLFPMAVFQVNVKRPFRHSNRVQPVYFRYAYRQVDRVTIALPTGYRVEAVPEDASVSTSFATFLAKHTSDAGGVRLERQTDMNGYYFRPESYGSLWQYFQQLRKSDAENVVLHVEPAQGR